jgi:hypothetical protein
MRTRILLCLGLAVLTTLAAQAYQLRFAGSEGDTRTFEGTVSTTEPKGDGSTAVEHTTATLRIREQVRAVADGQATVERSVAMMAKDSTDDTLGIHYTAMRTPLGEMSKMVLKSKTGETQEMPAVKVDSAVIDPMGDTLILPKNDVKIGDTWQVKGATQFVTNPSQIVNGTYDITYKLSGVQVLDGKQCLRIIASYTLTMPKQPLLATADDKSALSAVFIGTTTFYFNTAAGAVQGMDLNMSGKVKVVDGTETQMDGAVALHGMLRLVVTRF